MNGVNTYVKNRISLIYQHIYHIYRYDIWSSTCSTWILQRRTEERRNQAPKQKGSHHLQLVAAPQHGRLGTGRRWQREGAGRRGIVVSGAEGRRRWDRFRGRRRHGRVLTWGSQGQGRQWGRRKKLLHLPLHLYLLSKDIFLVNKKNTSIVRSLPFYWA